MEYTDPVTNEKFLPTVIESSHGCDRLFLACIADAYEEEKLEKDDTRVVLHFHPRIAPYKVAVLPLQKKEHAVTAYSIFKTLSKSFMCTYDETASIGKRYRRADEIGTPFCVTIDFETEKDKCVTVRDRDTMKQERIKVDDLAGWIYERIK
jgi:glycyl-tRNA synthetase